MSLEVALQEHEEKVDTLLRSANRYVNALKSWRKACQTGHLGNLQKAAAQAEELCGTLPDSTAETRSSWTFDARDYLESGDWRRELQAVAAERFNLRALEDEDTLISSPLTVRAQPGRLSLLLGKVNWPSLRPRVVAAELKRLRDRTSSANSQEFVESLYNACKYLTEQEHKKTGGKPGGANAPDAGEAFGTFRNIYDLFCLTPGYKKENPPAAFGQQIYALHRSDIRATRGGRKLEFEYATGNVRERQIFTVIAEDGRPIRYHSIWFR